MTHDRPFNRKIAQPGLGWGWRLRVFERKGRGKLNPRRLIKCGCCEQRLEIYYDDEGLEINGVCASIEEWREVLLPLLRVNPPRQGNRT